MQKKRQREGEGERCFHCVRYEIFNCPHMVPKMHTSDQVNASFNFENIPDGNREAVSHAYAAKLEYLQTLPERPPEPPLACIACESKGIIMCQHLMGVIPTWAVHQREQQQVTQNGLQDLHRELRGGEGLVITEYEVNDKFIIYSNQYEYEMDLVNSRCFDCRKNNKNNCLHERLLLSSDPQERLRQKQLFHPPKEDYSDVD